ncbi:class I SAM-dependent methyltransferase [Aureimonas jatrophae]|uniref:Predicted nicotinamide N-methyase n=1 Tax=Aureimonas jatrophae TaxID=1166073 RepID=A0A1H0KW27_9HYPH|nr:50S ribosomal protein L11 methyltransferase [Aureimonas jatrophae]MBB3948898.1 putative nicotinamide N-methyase [Aureimonas jatrophae]SDO59986.1 Predicted nicotinamide N-methyase [Aureimonas jatrophae]
MSGSERDPVAANERTPHEAFVLANTRASPLPSLPSIRLRQAEEAHDLWHRTERELETAGLPPPFWAFAWVGGLGLARFILDEPHHVRGRRVLDFATGSGLVAIAAAQAGAREVTACDTDPFAQAAARLNAAANAVALEIDAGDRIGGQVDADILLAGDVFYDAAFAARLVPWFDTLARAGCEVLVGDPGRAYAPGPRLVRLGEREVPASAALEDADRKTVTIWRWRSS